MATLASAWADRGDDVSLVTLDARGQDFHTLSPKVARVRLDVVRPSATRLHALLRQRKTRRTIADAILPTSADVVLSFLTICNVLVLGALAGRGVPVVVSERIVPEFLSHPWWRYQRRRWYPTASAVVVQSASLLDWAGTIAPRAHRFAIPNPVLPPAIAKPEVALRAGGPVMAIGRLDPQKGFDLLLRAFAGAIPRLPPADCRRLVIVGQGAERERLMRLADSLGVGDRIELAGERKDVASLLAGASLLVSSSRREGFPNVLLEAMAAGLAVIATDCPGATREIVRHGIDGVVVPSGDVGALADALVRLLIDSDERARLGREAVSVLDRFGLPRILAAWDRAFATTIGNRER